MLLSLEIGIAFNDAKRYAVNAALRVAVYYVKYNTRWSLIVQVLSSACPLWHFAFN